MVWSFSCRPISSVQFSRSVVSDSLQPRESQHARPPCPSPTPRVHWDSRPSSQWCHPAISSSVVPFFSCPQPLPASESFPMSQLFTWGGQSTGVSALASFLPKKSQGWSPSQAKKKTERKKCELCQSTVLLHSLRIQSFEKFSPFFFIVVQVNLIAIVLKSFFLMNGKKTKHFYHFFRFHM